MSQPGPQMRGLDADLNQTLLKALTCMDYEDFQQSFAQFTAAQQLALFDLYRQVLHQIRTNSEAEFSDFCKDHQLASKMDALEDLKKEAELQQSMQSVPGLTAHEAARRCSVAVKRAELDHLIPALQKAEEDKNRAKQERDEAKKRVDEAVAAYQSFPKTLEEVHKSTRTWASTQNAQKV